MAYRLLREFRQAFTRLDTPPFSIRHHPGSVIALGAAADLIERNAHETLTYYSFPLPRSRS
jgi:hypothetical protein